MRTSIFFKIATILTSVFSLTCGFPLNDTKLDRHSVTKATAPYEDLQTVTSSESSKGMHVLGRIFSSSFKPKDLYLPVSVILLLVLFVICVNSWKSKKVDVESRESDV